MTNKINKVIPLKKEIAEQVNIIDSTNLLNESSWVIEIVDTQKSLKSKK